MSWQATRWAADTRAGSASGKIVLLLLANFAGQNGECWPSQQVLAEQAEMSVDSVQRRLVDLEKAGLIYRVTQRHAERSGRWTSGLIVLLMDEACRAFALQHGFDPERVESGAGEGESAPEAPENQGESDGVAEMHRTANCGAVKMHHAADCGTDRTATVRYGNIKQEESILNNHPPKAPQIGAAASPAANEGAALDRGWLDEWDRFAEAWPWPKDELPGRARERFRQLTPQDRAAALAQVGAYAADCRAKGKRAMAAKSWLAERGWEPWARRAKGQSVRAGDPVFVKVGTPAFEAWLRFKRATSLPTVRRVIDGKACEGWLFPTLFPPGMGEGERTGTGG